MDQLLADIHIATDATQWIIAGTAVLLLLLGIWLWRRKPRRISRRVGAVVCWVLTPVLGVLAVGAAVNTHFAYFDTLADLFGIPTYPTGQGGSTAHPGQQEPAGLVGDLTISDTSGFGDYPAKAFLPPQYFSSPRQHFPVVYLLHGTPGQITDWVSAGGAATTGLASADAGKPVILVFPESNRGVTNDSECVDSPVEGNAETYLLHDVVGSVDKTLRTLPTAESRAIGGLSEGGFCALNLGLKNPTTYSVALDFSGETSPTYDPGLQVLFGSGELAGQVRRAEPRAVRHHARRQQGPCRLDGRGHAGHAGPRPAADVRAEAPGAGLHRPVPHPSRRARLHRVGCRAEGLAAWAMERLKQQ